ncbi:DUF2235 domain-containing protein [Qingshengfaniella alkalisoli]|uniref:DUF2235 domain-containing protein n=1 Tax=Qingshengfaniella alkalisoli TaxID=2599296 RepID=A0A5B8I7Y6_9RHOB|nr:DUF2235 domain-containing protein [Qingshengfaniella alkalisoli]QDY68676.1 DUF2235 domain-containing protein [Qingshengfaniella alkalisoli]
MNRLVRFVRRLLGPLTHVAEQPHKVLGARDHVVLMDGTTSTLEPGFETNIGLIRNLLMQLPAAERPVIYYRPGLQWGEVWRERLNVLTGHGVNDQIRETYGALAARYRPGDRIFLFGYSRGAFAVRSLAGIINLLGLLDPVHATESNLRDLYRHYVNDPTSDAARAFVERTCQPGVQIEMVGVFDTVKALGWRLPGIWRLTEKRYAFHSSHLGATAKHGFHALARDETREAYAPVMWTTQDDYAGHVEQVWFRGNHGDIGGHIDGMTATRPLSNIPLVWMLEQAEGAGLSLPDGWRAQFPRDAGAPSIGYPGPWDKLFVLRRARVIGADPSERLHETAR